MFVLFIILGSLCLFLCWLFLAPVILEVDTEVPKAEFRFVSIGRICIWYDGEWWFSVHVFVFRKTMPFAKLKKRSRKGARQVAEGKRTRKLTTAHLRKKIVQLARASKITEWRLAIDTGSFYTNARLYPLNFLSCTSGHLFINFQGSNFLKVQLKSRPWKIVYAFLK